MNNCITLENITKRNGSFSLSVPKMEIPKGGKVVILGEEGCGKSTFLRCLFGLSQMETGEISFFQGESLEECLSHTAVILGNATLPHHLTPKEVGRIFSTQYRQWNWKLYGQLLEELGMKMKEPLGTGRRGRECLFACGIAYQPDLFVVDRPCGKMFFSQEEEESSQKEGELEHKKGIWQESEEHCLSLLTGFHLGGTQVHTRHSVEDLPAGVTHLGFFRQGALLLYGERSDLLLRCGKLRCDLSGLRGIEEQDYLVAWEREEGYEVLVSDRVDFFMKYPVYPMVDVSISDIWEMLQQGQKFSFLEGVAV